MGKQSALSILSEREKTIQKARATVHIHLRNEIGIPAFIERTTNELYERLYDTHYTRHGVYMKHRGNIFVGIIAATCYYAFKHHNMPRTPREVCVIFNVTRQLFSKGCHHCALLDCLPLVEDTAQQLFHRFSNKLGIEYKFSVKAVRELYEPNVEALNSFKPAAVAGGMICVLIDQLPRDHKLKILSTRQVCEVVGVCLSIVRAVKYTLVHSNNASPVDSHGGSDSDRDRDADIADALFSAFEGLVHFGS